MNEDKFMARNHCLKSFNEDKMNFISKIKLYIGKKFDVWDLLDLLPYRWRMYYYDYIKPLYNPSNKRIRKFIPRTWKDISCLMVDVNFEFIKIFYEDEYNKDIVDWNATEHHKEFAEWLERAYSYITKERPKLQKDLENAYPPCRPLEEMFEPVEGVDGLRRFNMLDDGIPYKIKYAEVIRIEELIDNTDTTILNQFIEKRNYFWT